MAPDPPLSSEENREVAVAVEDAVNINEKVAPEKDKMLAAEEANFDRLTSDADTIDLQEIREQGGRGFAPDATPAKQANDGEPEEYITGMRLFTVMASITLVCFLMLLDMSIIVTAIPRITTEFSSLQDVGWYGSAYNLASAALQPLTGKFYTYFKAKWTFIFFLALFMLGSLICGVANSSSMLIGGRVVAGLGTSGLQNGAMTIISNSAPLSKRPALIGILLGFGQLGIVIGPLVGGAITEYSTWRWCFYLNLPTGAVVLLLLFFTHVPERTVPLDSSSATAAVSSKAKILLSKLDLSGFAIFAPAAIMFLLGLEFGGREHPWNSAIVIGLLVGSIGAFAVFFLWEYRQGDDTAMFPLGMVRRREVWTSMLASMSLMGGITFINSYYLPIYFQAVRGVSPFLSGVYVLPGILSTVIAAVASGVLVGKLGYHMPWTIAAGAISAVGNGLLSTLSPSSTTGQWVGYQILSGFGRGLAIQMPIIAVQAVLPAAQVSVATALLVFSQTFGGAFFLTIGQTIFTNSLGDKITQYAPNVNADMVIAAGATGIRDVVRETDLPGVLLAYADSVDRVFYVATAAGCLLFAVAWGTGWNDIREKKAASAGEEQA